MEINSTDIIINPSINNVYGFLILSSFSVLIGTVPKDKAEIKFLFSIIKNIYILLKYIKLILNKKLIIRI